MVNTESSWSKIQGTSSILATAIHHGNQVRDEVYEKMKLSDPDRLREEDPYTGLLTTIADNRIILNTSRFEVDLNRPREKAIYVKPEDAWGLDIWKEELSKDIISRSVEKYDAFYSELNNTLKDLEKKHGSFVVYDIHSYNHRRNGPDAPDEDPEQNPELNLGTGTVDPRWDKVVDAFMESVNSFDYNGRSLDARKNIKFKGGWMSRWIHENFPETGLCLSIEFKKFFMDEWTGKLDESIMNTLNQVLKGSIEPVTQAMKLVSVK